MTIHWRDLLELEIRKQTAYDDWKMYSRLVWAFEGPESLLWRRMVNARDTFFELTELLNKLHIDRALDSIAQ